LSELTLTVEGLNETDAMMIGKLGDHENRIVELEASLTGSRIESGMTTSSEITKSLEDLESLLKSNKDEEGNQIFTLTADLELVNLKAERGEFEELRLGEKSSGKGVIEAGETEVLIETPQASESSNIMLTITGNNQSKVLFVDEIVEGESFKVKFNEPVVEEEVGFNWIIVGGKENN
jgi:hypothetical protein